MTQSGIAGPFPKKAASTCQGYVDTDIGSHLKIPLRVSRVGNIRSQRDAGRERGPPTLPPRLCTSVKFLGDVGLP